MKDPAGQNEKKWFRKSGFLMWYPVTWQGWLLFAAFLFLGMLSVYLSNNF